METKINYKKVFENIVTKTTEYVRNSGRSCMVLGVSGGIDSTIVAIIGEAVSKRLGIPLLGRSLTIKNKKDEVSTAALVGKAFFEEGLFKEVNMSGAYHNFLQFIIMEEEGEKYSTNTRDLEMMSTYQTPLANGNIQARLRNNYLYNLAGTRGGLVLDTDNLTEHNLGFFTIHGDEGDYNPIGGLWKHEIYELAKWLLEEYDNLRNPLCNDAGGSMFYQSAWEALLKSANLIPTDGNGVSDSDLSQIGGKDYYEVDSILQPIVEKGWGLTDFGPEFDETVVSGIFERHKNSEFKRLQRPVKISREDTLFDAVA